VVATIAPVVALAAALILVVRLAIERPLFFASVLSLALWLAVAAGLVVALPSALCGLHFWVCAGALILGDLGGVGGCRSSSFGVGHS
jgi:hypothetical protein